MVVDIDISPKIDDSEIIWRYMDFASFYALLQSKELFFRRLDKYSDEYEGTLPEEIREFLTEYFTNLVNIHVIRSPIEATNAFISRLKELNTGTLSNSWVANTKEIYAMWKIYLRGSQEGVAIQSTVGKLREVLKDNQVEFTFAKVRYDILPWNQTDYKTLAAWKTEPYSYERELRVLVYDQFEEESKPNKVFPKLALYEHGNSFEIDVEKLIEHIYISPFAGQWFHQVVKSTVKSLLPSFDITNITSSRIKDK